MVNLNPDLWFPILSNNMKREHYTLNDFACQSRNAMRERVEKYPDKKNIRPAFFHDTDRIIHSFAYTRYIDKTQVFYLFDNDHITHRVLHVQLVSKIARVIGRTLKLNEDLLEAIALGHDLGHVPYGHNGERRLNKLLENNDFDFCHNAQSVRSLMLLEKRGLGLNLTLQVLDGILCHNGELTLNKYEPDYEKTWPEFKNEYNKCWENKDFSRKIIPMTLEGCVVRISDIISYLGRDLEDAVTLGVIKWKDIPDSITRILGNRNGDIIQNIVYDIINNSFDKNYIQLSDNVFKAIEDLKSFSISAIYNSPRITSEDKKIDNMFSDLFFKYIEDIKSGISNTDINDSFIKEMSEDYRKSNSAERIAVDYISGMTDTYFNNQYKDLHIPSRFGYKAKKE